MRSSSIPSSLHRRLRKYYTYYLDAGVNFGVQQEVLKELSPSLRTEVLLFLNKEMVAHIPFFHNQHPGFVVSVCSMLVPCFALSREYIFREGDEVNPPPPPLRSHTQTREGTTNHAIAHTADPRAGARDVLSAARAHTDQMLPDGRHQEPERGTPRARR